jgi:hypothetical protein
MPIRCDIHLNPTHLGGPVAEPARLETWHVEPGTIVERGTPIARLAAVKGEDLEPDAVLFQAMADGEEVPPGFAYCTMHAAPGS